MSDYAKRDLPTFFIEQLRQTKVNFERALDCKHTDFDDLYPYMNEQPQFFWYKRYVAWSELLTVVRLAEELASNGNRISVSSKWNSSRGKFCKEKCSIIGKRKKNKKKR